MTTNIIPLHTLNGTPRVSSEDIAEHLNSEHRAVLQLLRTHQEVMEERFGSLAFEMRVNNREDGRASPDTRFALLTEDQAYFLLALSRNTPPVVAAKASLVEAFSRARRSGVQRQALASGYRAMSGVVKQVMPDADRRDYAREADRLNRVVLGMPAGQFRLLRGVMRHKPTRDYCTDAECAALDALQALNGQLLALGVPADARDIALRSLFDREHADAVAADAEALLLI